MKKPINLDIAEINFGLENIDEIDKLKELAILRKQYHIQYMKKDKEDMLKTKEKFVKLYTEYKELKSQKFQKMSA